MLAFIQNKIRTGQLIEKSVKARNYEKKWYKYLWHLIVIDINSYSFANLLKEAMLFLWIMEFWVVFLAQSTPKIYLPELPVSISVSLFQNQELKDIGKTIYIKNSIFKYIFCNILQLSHSLVV